MMMCVIGINNISYINIINILLQLIMYNHIIHYYIQYNNIYNYNNNYIA